MAFLSRLCGGQVPQRSVFLFYYFLSRLCGGQGGAGVVLIEW